MIAAVPPREDPRDVLVSRDGLGLAELSVRVPRRHGLAASGGPAARARLWPGRRGHPRQRRHPAAQGRRRRGRRGRPRPRRAGPARLGSTRVTEVLDPTADAPGARPGRTCRRVPLRPRRTSSTPSPRSTTPPTRVSVTAERALARCPRGRLFRPGRCSRRRLRRRRVRTPRSICVRSSLPLTARSPYVCPPPAPRTRRRLWADVSPPPSSPRAPTA